MATITPLNIWFWSGTGWVSVKSGKISMHNGTAFTNLKDNTKIQFSDGAGNFYKIPVSATLTATPEYWTFLSKNEVKTFVLAATPTGTITVQSKPSGCNATVSGTTLTVTATQSIGIGGGGFIQLNCTNGATTSIEIFFNY